MIANNFFSKIKCNLFALPRTAFGSKTKIFIFNNFDAKHKGNDIYPPVLIKISKLFDFKIFI